MNNSIRIKSFAAYNTLGKQIANSKPNKNEFIVDANTLDEMVLFIKIELENGDILKTKFIKY